MGIEYVSSSSSSLSPVAPAAMAAKPSSKGESVIVVTDANHNRASVDALDWALKNVVRPKDTVLVLGVMYELGKKPSCFPFHMGISFAGIWERLEFSAYSEKSKSPREIEEEIEKKREQYQCSLQPFYRQCKRNEVKLEVKLAAGFEPRTIAVEEAQNFNTRWIVLDSTAGMEASGTSNMKFAMNGCILIGTLDGANVEIREEVGEDNFFLFGAKAHEIAGLRKERAEGKFVPDPCFEEVKEFVRSGIFGTYNYDKLLMGSLEGNEGYGRGDYFLVGKDFPSYIECQEKVDEAYQDQTLWTKMSILNTAGSYKFSSDRTIREYARDIWNIEPVELP